MNNKKTKVCYPKPEQVESLALAHGFTRRDARMLALACAEAYASPFDAFKVGCVLGNKNVVLATGSNTCRSDPSQQLYNLRYRDFQPATRYSSNEHSLHAEMSAMKAVSYPVAVGTDWKRVKAYVFRLAPGLPLGQGLAKPCPACAHALAEQGVRHVIFSTDDGFATTDLRSLL